jgi:hypothetical protein
VSRRAALDRASVRATAGKRDYRPDDSRDPSSELDSRSSAEADSCSTRRPFRTSNRPEQVTQTPELPDDVLSSDPVRGGSPEPRHLPTSGMVMTRVYLSRQGRNQQPAGRAVRSSGFKHVADVPAHDPFRTEDDLWSFPAHVRRVPAPGSRETPSSACEDVV